MTIGLRYWRLVRLDSGGKSRVEEIEKAKDFFQRQFSDLNTPDIDIQKRLLDFAKQEQSNEGSLAQICLRCWISSEIQRVCLYLEHQFGRNHSFTCDDLYPLVLDHTLETTDHKPLSLKILETFEPKQASLETWTNRKVKQELNAFLLERGVYLITDWAILNDTTGEKLEHILREFYRLGDLKIKNALLLLEAYHSVYLQDRLNVKKKRTAGKCSEPSIAQLQRMAQLLSQEQSGLIASERLLANLKVLAKYLRQYRLHVRGGSAGSFKSFEDNCTNLQIEQQLLRESETEEEQEQKEFLKRYREEFLKCLNLAIAQTMQARLSNLLPPKTEQFLQAMELLYCQGESMGDIAPQIGLNGQSQVTRLVKLKDFRADVQHILLNELSNCIPEIARSYLDPDQLLQIEQQIITILNEDITDLIKESADQTSTKKACRTYSLLAQHICQYLQQ